MVQVQTDPHAARLRDAASWRRQLFEHAPIGIYHITVEGQFVRVNPAMARIFGCATPDEFLTRFSNTPAAFEDPRRLPLPAYVHKASRDEFQEHMARHGVVRAFECRARRKDGTEFWSQEDARPLFDDDGTLLGYEGFIQDIDQRKAAELALARRADEQNALARLATQGLLTTDPDAVLDAALTHLGDLIAADQIGIFGYQPDDGRLLLHTGTGWDGGADDRASVAADAEALPKRALAAGRTLRVDDITAAPEAYELARRHGAGSAACAPIVGRAHPFGVVLVQARRPGAFDDQDEALLTSVAHLVASACARIRAEQARSDTEGQLHNVAHNLPGYIFRRHHRRDGSFVYTYFSRGLAELVGVDADAAVRDPERFLARVHADDRPRLERMIAESVRQSGPIDLEFRAWDRDGRLRWLHSTGRAVAAPDGGMNVDGVTLDVTERKAAETHLDYLKHHDPLTGFPNRWLFYQLVTDALARARHAGRVVAVAVLDIDRFNRIKSAHGHTASDRVLQEVGRRIAGTLYVRDTVARLDADRFLILFSALRRPDDVQEPIAKLLRVFARPVQVADELHHLSACVGVSLAPADGQDPETLTVNAETALVSAKRAGPASSRFYSPELTHQTVRFLQTQGALRRALANQEIVPHYQVQVAAADGAVVGLEALARWQHPNEGLVGPGAFIDVAEESGLVVDLTRAMLAQVCAQLAEWRAAGLADGLRLAVNLSGRCFSDTDIVHDVTAELEASGLPGAMLELEITETTLMQNLEPVREAMDRLGELGVGFAIDDFGKGYSSMRYLAELPLAALKIDRGFVRDLPQSRTQADIVRTIVSLAHGLGKRVLGEGVETAAEHAFLRELGVDEIQGFYWGYPVPAAQATALLRARPASG